MRILARHPVDAGRPSQKDSVQVGILQAAVYTAVRSQCANLLYCPTAQT